MVFDEWSIFQVTLVAAAQETPLSNQSVFQLEAVLEHKKKEREVFLANVLPKPAMSTKMDLGFPKPAPVPAKAMPVPEVKQVKDEIMQEKQKLPWKGGPRIRKLEEVKLEKDEVAKAKAPGLQKVGSPPKQKAIKVAIDNPGRGPAKLRGSMALGLPLGVAGLGPQIVLSFLHLTIEQ